MNKYHDGIWSCIYSRNTGYIHYFNVPILVLMHFNLVMLRLFLVSDAFSFRAFRGNTVLVTRRL